MNITIFGAGYVGLVSAACLAELGHTVCCMDLDPLKVETLKKSQVTFYEPGLESLIQKNISSKNLFFTASLYEAIDFSSVYMIAVGTPSNDDGSADLSAVMEVAKNIATYCKNEAFIIVKSTVPAGTSQKILELLKSPKIKMGSNPEFLKEGSAILDFMEPSYILLGSSDEKMQRVLNDIYAPLLKIKPDIKVFEMDIPSAECAKYAVNAMLATRVGFMNELSRYSEKIGANIDFIRELMGADSRIGPKFLYAGCGYGGSCFPKDVQAITYEASKLGAKLLIMEAVKSANIAQKNHCFSKILDVFKNNLNSKTFTIWGLAFKPSTDDVRRSPAIDFIEKLLALGAKVKAHDPKAMPNFKKLFPEIEYSEDPNEATKESSAIILVTEWACYQNPDWQALKKNMTQPIVFDFRNLYSFERLSSEGFKYYSIGRKDSSNPNSLQ